MQLSLVLVAALSTLPSLLSPEEAPKEETNWEASWSDGGSGAAGAEEDDGGGGAPPTSEPVPPFIHAMRLSQPHGGQTQMQSTYYT
jgi:hypothetical protein